MREAWLRPLLTSDFIRVEASFPFPTTYFSASLKGETNVWNPKKEVTV